MIRVDEKEAIRKLHLVQGLSIREIARTTGRSRQAIRRCLRDGCVPAYAKRAVEPTRKLLPKHQELIRQWLEEDKTVRRKQRHTGTRMASRLRKESDYMGSDASVRRFVAKIAGPSKTRAFIPLAFGAGESAQVDWGEFDAYVAGVLVTLQLFVMRLSYSKAVFAKAYFTQGQEAFFQGHVAAFAFFGGVARTLVYDNLKTAVHQIVQRRARAGAEATDLGDDRTERGRVLQQGFKALRSHFLFDSRFCKPGLEGAHEKGGVENGIGYVRRNWLVPVPRFETLYALNAYLEACCEEEQARTPLDLGRPIGVVLEEEQAHLLPLPAATFLCEKVRPARVTSSCTVSYKTHRYSVPWQFVGKKVLLHIEAEEIWVEAAAKEIARHPRLYGPQRQESLRLEHYLGLLAVRPGALVHARPFQAWLTSECPPVWRRAWERLERDPERSKRFVQLLEWRQELGEAAMHHGLTAALGGTVFRMEMVYSEALSAAAAGALRPAPTRSSDSALMSIEIPIPSLSSFDQLCPGMAGAGGPNVAA